MNGSSASASSFRMKGRRLPWRRPQKLPSGEGLSKIIPAPLTSPILAPSVCTAGCVDELNANRPERFWGRPKPGRRPGRHADQKSPPWRAGLTKTFRPLFAGLRRVTLRTSVTGGAASLCHARSPAFGPKSRVAWGAQRLLFSPGGVSHKNHRHRGDARPMPAPHPAANAGGRFGMDEAQPRTPANVFAAPSQPQRRA